MTDRPDPPDDADLMAYVRGTLGRDETAAVERASRDLPEVRADIALMRGLTLARETEGDAGPGEFGWARLSRAIDAEAAATPAAAPRHVWRQPLQIAAAALLAVAVWQIAVVPRLPDRVGDDSIYVPATGTAAGDVTVAFVPDATEAEIRALLGEIGAVVTGGPTALGLWTLGFPDAGRRDEGLRRLAAETDIVESVQAD